MKYILITLLALAGVALTGCDKEDDNNDNPIVDGHNFFESTFDIEDGCRVLKNTEPVSSDVIEDQVKGYGWKVTGIYAVDDKGHLSKTDYRTDMLGGGYTDYWFKSAERLVGFSHGDPPGKHYNTMPGSFDAEKGYILRGSSTQNLADRYMQVLLITANDSEDVKMYAMQKIGDATSSDGFTKVVYGMVIYQRMTDSELAQTQKTYGYDADRESSDAIPNSCKFKVEACYWNPDEFDENTSGQVIVAFGKLRFTLTDNQGTKYLPNPALDYYDSIVWRSNANYLPDYYVIWRKELDPVQTAPEWSTYFLKKDPDLTSIFEGYKNGRVAYAYEMRHDVFTGKFLCYDWESGFTSNAHQHIVSCLLDKKRSFTVYEPRIYNDDINKVYAELRYNSADKGNGDDVAILENEISELADLMTNHYGHGTDVGKQTDHYRALFGALPEKADIVTYWESADTRIAIVLNHSDTNAQDNYYYVHAEPR